MNGGYGILERIVRIGIVLVVVFLILAILVVLLASQNGKALTASRSLGLRVEQALIYAVVAAGMGLVMVAGEADLSVAGTASLAAIVMIGLMTNYHVPAPVAVGVTLVLGLFIGLLNGLLITLLRLPFYIVTSAAWGLTLGLGLFLSSGQTTPLPGRPVEWSLPLLVVLNLVVYGLGAVALFLLGRFTSLGKLTSLNARSEADGRPGDLALALYKIGAYTVSGLLAAVAGLALLNFVGAAQPGGYGDLVIAAAVAAAVIGGVPLWKGSTRLLGAFLGSVVLALIAQAILTAQIQGTIKYLPTSLAWAALAVPVAILWGVAGWVLDLVFGRRKGTQVGEAAQHVTGGDR